MELFIFVLSISSACSFYLHSMVPQRKRDTVFLDISAPYSHNRNKRHTDLPDSLHITLHNEDIQQTFRVEKYRKNNIHFPLYVNGQLRSESFHPKVFQQFYQCMNSECLFQAEKIIDLNTTTVSSEILLFGTFHIDGQLHILEPAENGQHTIFSPEVFQDLSYDVVSRSRYNGDESITEEVRHKRAVGNYKVELLMVLDYSVYQFWLTKKNGVVADALEAIRQFYAFMIKGMDLRYQNLPGATFTIDVLNAGLYILQDTSAASFIENIKICSSSAVCTVDAETALAAFRSWKQTTANIPPHDHAMLFTRYDMAINGVTNSTGFAYLDGICTTQSVSMIEEDFNFISQTIAAHELGHSLSAFHDGLDNQCSANDHFVMEASSSATNGTTASNPWKFSTCSVQEMNSRLNSLTSSNNNCLLTSESSNHDSLDSYLMPVIGQTYTVDEQCRLALGDMSFACRFPYFDAGSTESVCTGLWCLNPKLVNRCSLILPAEQTSCGSQKWCKGYHCEASSQAPVLIESCPFGDQSGEVVSGFTCSSLISQRSFECYNSGVFQSCCQSCLNIATGIADCEYGDKLVCSGITSFSCYTNGDQCCQTCRQYTTNITDCQYGDRGDCSGLTTGSQCYTGNNAVTCCKTCDQYKTDISGCEYGDKASNCDFNLCQSYSETDRLLCCQMCKDVTFNPTTITSTITTTTATNTSTLPAWVIPVAASSGVLVLVIIIITIICCLRMSRQSSGNSKPQRQQHRNTHSRTRHNKQNSSKMQEIRQKYPAYHPQQVKQYPRADNSSHSVRQSQQETYYSPQRPMQLSKPPTGQQMPRREQYYMNNGYSRY